MYHQIAVLNLFEHIQQIHFFDELTANGFKPKINIMGNQAINHIKKFLTEQQCNLQLVKPHNHRMNATERAIHTFKDKFIATCNNR
jgi:hypothetical protein